MRSENGTGATEDTSRYPGIRSEEVAAIAAYIEWLSEDFRPGQNLPWRGQNAIHQDSLIRVENLDTTRGRILFNENCLTCHGAGGQGVQIGDKIAGPLWGAESWNDGAGAARVYTLAGFIRYAMPYLNPGSLSDENAQQIAAFINSMPRPSYPFKDADYRVERIPADAVYYKDRR